MAKLRWDGQRLGRCAYQTRQRKGVITMEEIWKPVEGYDGRYEVSNLGRVKSYAQDRINGKIKLGNLTFKGYLSIGLTDANGVKKFIPVHRLVAFAFIPNPDNLPQVNHKDEIKTNNTVDNLEWCTNEYNGRYGTKPLRTAMANRCGKTTSRRVYSVDENGEVEFFDSIGEAERQTGLNHSNIVRTLKRKSHTCGNRQWFYC